MHKKLFIAIDGPSASGKGTIAKALGEMLSLPVLFTGNIYRAIAYQVLKNQEDPKNIENNIRIANGLSLSDLQEPNLNLDKVGQYASIIATCEELREVTYKFQRNFIESANGAVIEGRDIGTVICPEADFKFYITANVEVRAARRAAQLNQDYQQILSDLTKRDERDMNRKIAPLKPAEDAIIIDSSNLTVQETLEKILDFVKSF